MLKIAIQLLNKPSAGAIRHQMLQDKDEDEDAEQKPAF